MTRNFETYSENIETENTKEQQFIRDLEMLICDNKKLLSSNLILYRKV